MLHTLTKHKLRYALAAVALFVGDLTALQYARPSQVPFAIFAGS